MKKLLSILGCLTLSVFLVGCTGDAKKKDAAGGVKEAVKETVKEAVKETVKESVKDSVKDAAKDTVKEAAKDATKKEKDAK